MARKQWQTLTVFLTVFALCSVFLVACIRPGTSTGSTSSTTSSSTPTAATESCPSGTTVKTGTSNFAQSCITLAKGDTLTVTPDPVSYHILDFGQWSGTTQKPATFTGAPKLKDLAETSSSVKIGPFATAGTYYIYCTVHQNMTLKIIVK